MGNQIMAQAALEAGAQSMYSYPITPASEILETWVAFCRENPALTYLQTEDEMAAGFCCIGATFAGQLSFTATAGPGNILMQDAFSMAEAQRLPVVAMIVQRGGLSTSTVIYSQEEVRLTCFGGNGEGFRIVYSPSGLQEHYDYVLKAFSVAWKYRFPTFLLSDGYQGKMKGEVVIGETAVDKPTNEPILKQGVNLRNCYNLEEEIGEIILKYQDEYAKARGEIEESEEIETQDAETVIVAHGIVAGACQEAVKVLRSQGHKVGLFRPVTLRPFPATKALNSLQKSKRIIFVESALGQLAEIFKNEVTLPNNNLSGIYKPSVGFTTMEIVEKVKEAIDRT